MRLTRGAELGRKRVTLADVARAAEVSPTTASLVLSGRGDELRISTTVQQRVREASDAIARLVRS